MQKIIINCCDIFLNSETSALEFRENLEKYFHVLLVSYEQLSE